MWRSQKNSSVKTRIRSKNIGYPCPLQKPSVCLNNARK
uniref:Uncharacterized protein n=1 Tax=Anguilla anguilla TaxID=7936 RepID=A0A0E9RQT9_ANGAN